MLISYIIGGAFIALVVLIENWDCLRHKRMSILRYMIEAIIAGIFYPLAFVLIFVFFCRWELVTKHRTDYVCYYCGEYYDYCECGEIK